MAGTFYVVRGPWGRHEILTAAGWQAWHGPRLALTYPTAQAAGLEAERVGGDVLDSREDADREVQAQTLADAGL